jgi:uncharacterized protein (DUF58 family)
MPTPPLADRFASLLRGRNGPRSPAARGVAGKPAVPAAGVPRSFIDPAVLARVGNLELIARTVVDGFVSGLHRSPALGATTDFAEHRGYMPGDDTRRVDWRLYARTDRLHVKEFEADTNAGVAVLLDVSRSMAYASDGRPTKLDYARFLAASLLWLAQRQGDRVGLVTFDSVVRDFVPPSGKHLPHTLLALERATAGEAGELAAPLARVAEHFRRRGVLVVVSDLYSEPRAAIDAVLRLRNAGNELLLIHVLDPAELALPFTAPGTIEDVETGERRTIVPDAMREDFRARVAAHVAELERLARRARVDYALFDTAKPLDHALFHYLAGRRRLGRSGR